MISGHFSGVAPRYLMKADDDGFVYVSNVQDLLRSSPYNNMTNFLCGNCFCAGYRPIWVGF